MDAKNIYNWAKRYITIPLVGMICFVIYVCFFTEEFSVLDRMRYEQRIEELKAEIELNRDSLLYYREMNARLETNTDDIERVVRENYHMQRRDEDIYIFE